MVDGYEEQWSVQGVCGSVAFVVPRTVFACCGMRAGCDACVVQISSSECTVTIVFFADTTFLHSVRYKKDNKKR